MVHNLVFEVDATADRRSIDVVATLGEEPGLGVNKVGALCADLALGIDSRKSREASNTNDGSERHGDSGLRETYLDATCNCPCSKDSRKRNCFILRGHTSDPH